MLLWSIEPKLDWNRLLPTIESKNLVAIMIVGNSAFSLWNMHIFENLATPQCSVHIAGLLGSQICNGIKGKPTLSRKRPANGANGAPSAKKAKTEESKEDTKAKEEIKKQMKKLYYYR